MQLEKMLEMNTLLAFYGDLLTPRQQEFMKDYYQEDYTLQEIAENNEISRQAVSDSIRKAESALENFEEKLHIVQEFRTRRQLIKKIEDYISEHYASDEKLKKLLEELTQNKTMSGEG